MWLTKFWPLIGLLLWQLISYTTGKFEVYHGLPSQLLSLTNYPDIIHKGLRAYEQGPPLPITARDVKESVNFAKDIVEKYGQLEQNLNAASVNIEEGTPAFGQLIESRTNEESLEEGKNAIIATKASAYLVNTRCRGYGIPSRNCALRITNHKFYNTPLEDVCHKIESNKCENSLYRTFDGSCNNPNASSKGKTFTGYRRLLPPDYLDGIQEPRRSVTKKLLPNPRTISHNLGKEMNIYDSLRTLAFAHWGQFIEHDLAHTGARRMLSSGKNIQCCDSYGYKLSPRHLHPDCMHIDVPSEDPVYSDHFLRCMNYVRSQAAIRDGCALGYLDQMNQASHFLDASQIYGPTEKIAKSLRTMENGLLKTTVRDGREFLPLSESPEVDCLVRDDSSTVCFRAGDSRTNTNPQLSALYTIWVREHNRIARKLHKLNPEWSDEKLYQEARRIIIAEIQHITYEHWKPLVVGNSMEYKLDNDEKYSNKVDPSVSNSFATAGIRFINSMIDGNIRLINVTQKSVDSLKLSDHFHKPEILTKPGYFDSIIRGLAAHSSQKLDFGISSELTNNLFKVDEYGYDVLSLDIQRGRDHGLPSYNEYREVCGLNRVDKFSELYDTVSLPNIKLLQKIYAHPDDIDLLIGLLAEKPQKYSLVGPTLSCLIRDQFQRTKAGDRYFYTNADQPQPFTEKQLAEIKKSSLARVICDNGDNIEAIQMNVFEKIQGRNQLKSCNEIPRVNLQAWQSTA